MLGVLNKEQIEALLHQEITGRLGCHHDGKTYVVPITYVYDDNSIIGHSAEGLKVEMMRANPEVCFEVDHMYNMANWQSVIAWGRFEELHGLEAEQAMDKLISRLRPLMTSETSHPHEEATPGVQRVRAVIYRIHISEKTGRFEKR